MTVPGSVSWRNAEAGRLIAFGRAAALPGGGFGWLGGDGQVDPRSRARSTSAPA